jgi:hypothetical protein
MIIYQSFHNIDVGNAVLIRKQIPEDFNTFVDGYIQFATHNDSIRSYTVHDTNTTVVNCISEIATISVGTNALTEDQQIALDGFSHSIADKLLREEQYAQEKITAMGKQIKKGSLIQAFIKNDANEYMYIVAKVEHSEWYDGESLRKNFGFPSEKKTYGNLLYYQFF